jgi:gamma-glutamylcyclotransferase (GGCT)/AIG2-like uncharacterized protein YtfP
MSANHLLVENGFQYIGSSNRIKGTMISFGAFPGLLLWGDTEIVVDLYSFEDEGKLFPINRYEGYDPNNPEDSLYVLTRVPLVNNPETEVLCYEYNGTIRAADGRDIVEHGDWARYKQDLLSERHPNQAA